MYPRGHIPKALLTASPNDAEAQATNSTRPEKKPGARTGTDNVNDAIIQRQTAIFSWKDVVYDIKIKKEPRRILDHVDGWVKPGTLTALMVGAR